MQGAALIVLDGWGIAPPGPGNCVRLAKTPVVARLDATCPRTTLVTSGKAVGLPAGQMGNSEVGHLTLGSGRVIPQDLVRISDAIEDGSFLENPVLKKALEGAQRVHILGLASDGGVHSEIGHLEALAEAARRARKPFFFHAFTDGRDVAPTSGAGHVRRLAKAGPVATVCGRYYAMDRDKRWERTRRAYDAMVSGDCPKVADAAAAVEASYARKVTDEFVEPFTTGVATIDDGDVVVFANFRADRARQITEALTSPGFTGFPRSKAPRIGFVQMTRYREDFDLPVLYPRVFPKNVFGEVCGKNGIGNLRVAETEKYAHVTYFFNGGEETPFPGEERILVPSPKVATYDLKPEMSAAEVGRRAAEGVRSKKHRALILNFANPDMVGHTGVIPAATRACEAVDAALGEVLAAIADQGWAALVTADHGNAECLIDPETGGPHTAHTTNLVPCWLAGESTQLRDGGSLRDIAPTLLGLLGIAPPAEMTGRDLRKR
ncbi:MAG TPA: 2,3-bisphosphoglycerate-independent phosphoglycerate mutase [Planctomycetota bacterium]|nr:2,3-bisphosphoglycerate-independent phosphoglycerate mutase [Planctomycetota bacterium]